MEPEKTAKTRIAEVFFFLSLLLFLATRLVGLERFPIFFFCDEAVQPVRASELLENKGRDASGELLPTYFRNSDSYNLSIGVYAQLPAVLLAGHSVFATRATPVFLLLPAMAAVGLILRDFLQLRFWWIGVLLLSAMPAWFLHTRIAFELMLATGAYVGFLYFYLRYRSGRPRNLFPAIVCAALTFYGYNAFQPVMAVTALLLAAVDFPYHWRQRRTVLAGVAVLALCALPYARFLRSHPQEIRQRLQGLDSYWVDPALSTARRLRRFEAEYAAGFSPAYWFGTEPTRELARHEWGGLPFLFAPVLPLAVVGLFACLWRIRSPGPRTLVIALAAAPVGGALVHPGVTRSMTFVVIAAMLAAVSADLLLALAARVISPALVGGAVLILFAGLQGCMLADALLRGPTWFTDYGLYGLQYGARQVFGEARAERARHPQWPVYVSPVWINGAEDVRAFFCPGDPGVLMRNIEYYGDSRRDLTENAVHVLTAEEWERTRNDPRYVRVRTERVIAYPDGSPGFYFVRLKYSPRIDVLLEDRTRERHRLVEEEAIVAGEAVCVAHSRLDIGEIANLFDGKLDTLARTERINPAIVELRFEAPRRLQGVRLALFTSGDDVVVRARLEPADGSPPILAEGTYSGQPADPIVQLDFPYGKAVRCLRLEVQLTGAGEDFEVHLREMIPLWRQPEASGHD